MLVAPGHVFGRDDARFGTPPLGDEGQVLEQLLDVAAAVGFGEVGEREFGPLLDAECRLY